MEKNLILETAQAIIDMTDQIESLKIENKDLRDRLIHAQSETLAAIQNKPKPEPRDIGHENVIGFVTRKSGELKVSPGIVWGLIMDLISKNPDYFGTDADSLLEPVEPVDDEPFEFRVGMRVRVVADAETPEYFNGMEGTVTKNDDDDSDYPIYVILDGFGIRIFDESEIEFISRP